MTKQYEVLSEYMVGDHPRPGREEVKVLDLSDGLLERIFAAVDFEERHAVLPLVCKRFQEVTQQTPQLWKRTVSQLPATRALVPWFAARAQYVEELTVLGRCLQDSNELPSCHLLTAILTLAAYSKPGGSLQKLFVKLEHVADPHILLSVCQLTQLRTLCLESFSVPHHLQALSDLKHLTNLEHLSIKRSMIDLDVALGSSQACCFWTCVGTLQNLTTLDVCNMDFGLDVRVCGPTSIAQLTQLRSLTLGYNRLTELPHDFGNLTGLTQLEFCGEDFDVLHLQGLKSLRVVCLKLYLDNDLHDVGLPVSLKSFQVCAIGYTDRIISDQVWQKALSTQQFNLQQLFLEELGLEKLPEPVVQLRRLRVLGLASNKLEDIPAGPYLENLSVLDLHSNLMRSIPPALAGCSSLYELHVELNIFLYPSEGCLCVLLSLPKLGILGVDQAVLDFYHTKIQHGAVSISRLIKVARRLPISEVTGTYIRPTLFRCRQPVSPE